MYLYIFSSYLVFDGIFLLRGVLCLIGTLFVSCSNCLLIYIYELFIDIYLYLCVV